MTVNTNKVILKEFLVKDSQQSYTELVYTTVYNVRYDKIYNKTPSYTEIYEFSKYPIVIITSIDHQQKKYHIEQYNAKEELKDGNKSSQEFFKNIKTTKKQDSMIVNNRKINTIKYILTYENIEIMSMSMANIKDLLNEQDIKFYQQISLTNPLNPGMLELFKKMDAINKIYQTTKEGFTMVEMITLESKFSMKLNNIKIIDYDEKLFSIPEEYIRQDINQKENNQIEAK
jgi:hypothetical protein